MYEVATEVHKEDLTLLEALKKEVDHWKSMLEEKASDSQEDYSQQQLVLGEIGELSDRLENNGGANVYKISQKELREMTSDKKREIERQKKADKLANLGISIKKLTNEPLQAIESSQYAGESINRLGIKFNGNDCFMKVISRDRQTAENHRDNNSHEIRMGRITGDKDEIQQEAVDANRYHDEQTRLLSDPDSLAHMSIIVYSPSPTNPGKKTVLGYSDFIVHKDENDKIIVEAPVRALNLGSERKNEPGFNYPLYNALDVKDTLRGSGLGQFLVEIGSNIAAKRFGAEERVFATDSTGGKKDEDGNERGSFYVNKLGANLEKRKPYGQNIDILVPVMSISEQSNEDRTWPFLSKVKWT